MSMIRKVVILNKNELINFRKRIDEDIEMRLS